jgi:integrase
MATQKLTTKGIKALRYAGGWDVRWDAMSPGFGVRIYPSGRKAFVLRYRTKGRKRMVVLGDFGTELTLDQARDRALKARAAVRDGTDPLEEKRRASAAKTFGELAEQYVEAYARHHKKTWETDRDRLKRHIPAGWRSRKVGDIAREDVESLHKAIGKTRPYEANRTLDLLRVVFRQAKLWHALDIGAENPAEGVQKYPEKKRKRWAREHELPAIAAAIDEEVSVYVRAALWLYLLTGMRKTELLEARRDQIDWNRGMLELPDTKSGETQFVSLSAPALAILQSVPAQDGSPFILPGAREGGHLVNIAKPWRRVRDRATVILWADDETAGRVVTALTKKLDRAPKVAEVVAEAERRRLALPGGVADLRLHDLRRTVGSWLSQDGVDLNRVRDALRHANISTTLTYAKLGEDPVREAMERHGQRILEAAGKRGPVAVVGGNGEK